MNAAAPGVREPFSFDWYNLDLDIGISLPGTYRGTDFSNRGTAADPLLRERVDNFLFVHGAAMLQLGEFGAAITTELLRYNLTPTANDTPGLVLNYARFHVATAYGFAGNQIVLGGGLRVIALQIGQEGGGQLSNPVLTMAGAAPEIGFVYKPDNRAWRIGATVRAPVNGKTAGSSQATRDEAGVERAGPFILPSRVIAPWELEAGFAFQLGARPLNPPWLNPHDQERPMVDATFAARAVRKNEQAALIAEAPPAERAAKKTELAVGEKAIRAVEQARLDEESSRLTAARRARDKNWPRERILLLASLLVSGPSTDAVALEGFLEQKREFVGARVDLSPRLGIESEPLPNWLRVRAGTYLEPSRYSDGFPRQHFTFGGDVKLFPFDLFGFLPDRTWRLTVSGDLAPRYTNFGLGISAWH